MAHFIFHEDQLTFKKIIGSTFGIIGVTLINLNFYDENNDSSHSTNNNRMNSIIGHGMIILSSLCSALGILLLKIKVSPTKKDFYISNKNWKIFNRLIKKRLPYLKEKMKKEEEEEKQKKTLSQVKQNLNSTSIEITTPDLNTFENEIIHYPLNFDMFFDKSYSFTKDKDIDEKTEYIPSLKHAKLKIPGFNEYTLRSSYYSIFTNHNSLIFNNYLIEEESHEKILERAEVSSRPSKVLSKDSGDNSYINTSKNKQDSMEYEMKPNKDSSIHQIVELYSHDSSDIIMMTGYQMIIGSLLLSIVGLLWNIFSNADYNNNLVKKTKLSLYVYIIIGVIVITTALTFSLWNILMKYNSICFLSFFNFLIPIFSKIFSGLFFRIESIFSAFNLVSLILVCLGIGIASF
ncbi:hypothetical protein BCR36DRAFT_579009 [Piromyces finnis]|uniref:EamA domain-containing protein n=1 Tax=Piromyces finnis TaxID=1754191 RepID=A0A1Y1VNE0_9FUNG|nr:hypothetical protein BCR36DRAFT_579009 [Piromyces finnis]|eukprot:ORX60937.1 hypothetical protein BCR36DRAFT_579009 [Piromyces finnis]